MTAWHHSLLHPGYMSSDLPLEPGQEDSISKAFAQASVLLQCA